MKENKYRKGLFTVLCIIMMILLDSIEIKAAYQKIDTDEDGNWTFETTDTKATNSITWETIGFTVCRVPTGGDPTTVSERVEIYLDSGNKIERDDGSTVYVKFTITEKVVSDALEMAGLGGIIKDGDKIYLNGIFRVRQGNTIRGVYNTLEGIRGAEQWVNSTKQEFADRFDRVMIYKGGKHPVTIEYQVLDGGVIGSENYGDHVATTKFKTNSTKIPNKKDGYDLYRVYYINLNKPKTKVGNRKTSINPNFFMSEYLSELSYVRDREFIVKSGGLKIVAMYRKFSDKQPSVDEDTIVKEYEEIDPTGVLLADKRGAEQFDVLQGIPTTENLYANVISSKYLVGYTFKKISGTKVYPIRVSQQVTLNWTEKDDKGKDVPKTDSRNIIKTYPIERKFSYWEIMNLGLYGIDSATIENGALASAVTLTPKGYTLPTVTHKITPGEVGHIKEPIIKDVVLPSITLNQKDFPNEDWKGLAEDSVDKIKCKNDKLIFNGTAIMDDKELEEKTESPKEVPEGLEEIGENVLFQEGLMIPATKANKEYETTGTIYYKPIAEINAESPQLVYDIEDINSVTVHTPTVCDAQIQDNFQDNQKINPTYGMASLILDRPFYVTLPTTGSHRYIKGYGYRDYGKYIASREVRFPFDVYRGSSSGGMLIPKNSWTSIAEDTQFYLPTWVPEGQYTISFQSAAINASANGGFGNTESLANLSLSNYVAIDTTTVDVSGRVYGFHIYDITDYPIWEKVFRTDIGKTKLSGFTYTVGTKNQNGVVTGQNSKYTIPLVNGSHPQYKNQGVLKTGYAIRFSLKTIGTMHQDKDYIRMKPTFYYVDAKGNNRQPVDIYYSETFNGKKQYMVKIGSSIDLENKKEIMTGDRYLSIDDAELYQAAVIKGITKAALMVQRRKVFTYTNIMIPESLRTFVGYHSAPPSSVPINDIAKSVQNWYGEYYFPSEIHVAPKDFDILTYVKKNGPLTYKESFWLKDGYIIVNFEIETVQNGNRYLSYINKTNEANGYCNMWKREGFSYTKTDYKNNIFTFIDGDFILYHTDHSVSSDWISSGTH